MSRPIITLKDAVGFLEASGFASMEPEALGALVAYLDKVAQRAVANAELGLTLFIDTTEANTIPVGTPLIDPRIGRLVSGIRKSAREEFLASAEVRLPDAVRSEFASRLMHAEDPGEFDRIVDDIIDTALDQRGPDDDS